MSQSTFNRRTFLRGLGAGAIALPFLPSLVSDAHAGPPGVPRRLVVFVTQAGFHDDEWLDGFDNGAWNVSQNSMLWPLKDFQQKITLVDGFDMRRRNRSDGSNPPGDAHTAGMGRLMTGDDLMEGDQFRVGDNIRFGWASSISLDQYLAQQLDLAKPLNMGWNVHAHSPWGRLSYMGKNAPVVPYNKPQEVYNNLFSGFDNTNEELLAAKKRRQKINQMALSADFQTAKRELSSDDWNRVQAHLQQVDELQKQLDQQANSGVCQPPAEPGGADADAPETLDTQLRLMVKALECNMTQIATFQCEHSARNTVFDWVDSNISRGHHILAHSAQHDGSERDQVQSIHRWYAQRFATLLGLMDQISYPDGSTMLDQSAVLWLSDMARGNHQQENCRAILAGGNDGFFKTNDYVELDNVSHNNLLVELARSMGLQTDTFGAPRYVDSGGNIPQIRA